MFIDRLYDRMESGASTGADVRAVQEMEARLEQGRQWAALWKRVAKKYHEYYRLRDDCNMHCHGYLQQWADRAKKAEAELAALRARRCETCVTYINPSATGWGHCTYYNEFREHDTVCRRWEARRSRNER
mgnify:CR=1 FL=1